MEKDGLIFFSLSSVALLLSKLAWEELIGLAAKICQRLGILAPYHSYRRLLDILTLFLYNHYTDGLDMSRDRGPFHPDRIMQMCEYMHPRHLDLYQQCFFSLSGIH